MAVGLASFFAGVLLALLPIYFTRRFNRRKRYREYIEEMVAGLHAYVRLEGLRVAGLPHSTEARPDKLLRSRALTVSRLYFPHIHQQLLTAFEDGPANEVDNTNIVLCAEMLSQQVRMYD